MSKITPLRAFLPASFIGALALTAQAPVPFTLQRLIQEYAPTNQQPAVLTTKTNIQPKFSTQFSATPPTSVEEYAPAPQGSNGFTLPPVWIDPHMLKNMGYTPSVISPTNALPLTEQITEPATYTPSTVLSDFNIKQYISTNLPVESLDSLVATMTAHLPSFPIAQATFDKEGRIVGNITRVDYPTDPAMVRIDTPVEFARFMNVVGNAYPGNSSTLSFGKFATTYVSPAFALELESAGQGYGAAMALMADYNSSLQPGNALPGLIVRTNELGYTVTGSLDRINEVKARSFRPSREERSTK